MSELSAAIQEAAKRKKRRLDWKPEKILFDQQMKVWGDESRYRFLRCGRRSGKSFTWAFCLIDEALKYPGSTPLYVTMSRQDAKDIIWPAIDLISDTFGLGLIKNLATGDVTVPQTNSRIMLRGAGSLREMNKCRGNKYPCAIVDEAQAFGPDLYYFIDEVLEPATADYHGWIGIAGTPAVQPVGPFYEMDLGDRATAWSHHSWTFLQNPTMPDPQKFISDVMFRRGWDEDHPGFKREYLGQWVADESSRSFRFTIEKSVVPSFEDVQGFATDWQWVMGIDVGFNDPFAYVVIAYSTSLGQAFIVDSYEQGQMQTVEALTVAERFCQQYPIRDIALDTGGAGKLVAEDWIKQTALPIKAAKKTHKASQVSVINGDFDAGKVFICRDKNAKLINDLMVLEWDQQKLEQQKHVYRRGFADHLADAFQYGYSLCNHQFYAPTRDRSVKYGTPAYYKQKEDQWEKAAIKRLRQRERDSQSILSMLDTL
jgi:hypothetical protein